jgi:3-deoxy-manno-octulosonate cytidylyltransferase (CMP-KDO synthetase)
MKIIAVIPARYGATRLPGKPLLDIHGKPMIQWVYEKAKEARLPSEVVVATDDERILKVVEGFGGRAVLTSSDLPSGTDRIAAVAADPSGQYDADIYLNIQGDEPLMASEAIDAAVELITLHQYKMATVMTPLSSLEDLDNPNVVKVIANLQKRAIYFSRLSIPYSRGERPKTAAESIAKRHVGLYAYTREVLFQYMQMKPSPIENGEVLEQLRALEAGIDIGIAEVDFLSIGVDTQADLERVRKILKPIV